MELSSNWKLHFILSLSGILSCCLQSILGYSVGNVYGLIIHVVLCAYVHLEVCFILCFVSVKTKVSSKEIPGLMCLR